ncbi:MAG: hypothetical protein OHK0039_15610 [Bacteroidia bacterium]
MVLDKLLLNFSLLLSLLIAPCFLLLAYWYRRQLSRPLMIWKNSEMVIVTIMFSVAMLILFIVGTSSFFTYYNVLNPDRLGGVNNEKFFTIGLTCVLLMVALVFFYVAVRLLLVRIVSEQGIVVNDRFFRIPDFRSVIYWQQIADYYQVSDYPNVIYTLIIRRRGMEFDRFSLRVPVYMRDSFEDLLESQMNGTRSIHSPEDIGSRKYYEN